MPSNFRYITPVKRVAGDNKADDTNPVIITNPEAMTEPVSPIKELRLQPSLPATECELTTSFFSFQDPRLNSVSEEDSVVHSGEIRDTMALFDACAAVDTRSRVTTEHTGSTGGGSPRHQPDSILLSPVSAAHRSLGSPQMSDSAQQSPQSPQSPGHFQARPRKECYLSGGSNAETLSEARDKRLTHVSFPLGVQLELGMSEPNLCDCSPQSPGVLSASSSSYPGKIPSTP